MKFTDKAKAVTAAIATVAVIGLGAAPAFAGTRANQFTDVNPGFSSSSWTDDQSTTADTVLRYEACGTSNGAQITDLHVELWDQHGILPDAIVGNGQAIPGCNNDARWSHANPEETGYTLRNSTFFWKFYSINGGQSLTYMYGTEAISW